MGVVFVDTSAFYAILDVQEQYHSQARTIMRQLAKDQDTLYTSNFVIAETHALVLKRRGSTPAYRFLEFIFQSTIRIVRVDQTDETQARSILFGYMSKGYSYTDAVSFAIMRRIHIHRAFTFDDHFAQHGFMVPS